MKQFKVFFILLIGMIGFTAMASVPSLEQKKQTTIEKSVITVQAIAIDSQAEFILVNHLIYEKVIFYEVHPRLNFLKNDILNKQYFSYRNYQDSKIPYTKKLTLNYSPDKRNSYNYTRCNC